MSETSLQNHTKDNDSKLNSKQLKLLEVLTDFENPVNISEACEKAGVSRVTYYEWIKLPEFEEALYNLRKKAFASVAPKIDSALIRGATSQKGTADRRLFYQHNREIGADAEQGKGVTLVMDIDLQPDFRVISEIKVNKAKEVVAVVVKEVINPEVHRSGDRPEHEFCIDENNKPIITEVP